ncbi:hypothetical protein Y032_0110g134 [Ancylostoma ceylanicum]|uniref:Uncharacterized protein n=1 Tax=Ancylostoma ceylanicum TaxID=53326 RepID=A0A016TEP5_9BILA|nr:hypothetical protein Y032_0110g134 [Ancylostoma ceylanicum]
MFTPKWLAELNITIEPALFTSLLIWVTVSLAVLCGRKREEIHVSVRETVQSSSSEASSSASRAQARKSVKIAKESKESKEDKKKGSSSKKKGKSSSRRKSDEQPSGTPKKKPGESGKESEPANEKQQNGAQSAVRGLTLSTMRTDMSRVRPLLSTKAVSRITLISPDFGTTAKRRHMDEVKEETPNERGVELRLAAIHSDVTWRSIRIIPTFLISY